MHSRAFFRRGLQVALAVAGLHSAVLGLLMIFYTNPFLEIMGLSLPANIFYHQQSGVFLLILGIGYAIGASDPDRHRGLVALAVISKGLAILFLFYHVLALEAPRPITEAAFGDAAFFSLFIFFAWKTYSQNKKK